MRATPWGRTSRRRSPLGAVVVLIAIALLAATAAFFLPAEPTLSGMASAVDGDTLRLGDTRIRLTGIDAVELEQTCVDASGTDWPCGREARSFLAATIRNRAISCVPDGRDRYGRVLAHCAVDERDIGDRIVRAGWAVAELEYGIAVADARFNRRGIWAGGFDDPARWRADHNGGHFDPWGWLMGWLGS